MCCCFFFFFKQKTAYEMRISDWSSDVCSSDLGHAGAVVFDVDHQEVAHRARRQVQLPGAGLERIVGEVEEHAIELLAVGFDAKAAIHLVHPAGASGADFRQGLAHLGEEIRSEEHTSELQSLMRTSYAVFCLKKNNKHQTHTNT